MVGIYFGTRFNFCREHRTTVPEHVQREGHRPSGPHSASSSSSSHRKSPGSTSSIGTLATFAGE